MGVFAQTIIGSFQHDGIQRNYRLHLPPNLQSDEHLPLVFNLHGFTSNAQQQELYSGMNEVADTARFLVCYPDGIGNAWNIGVAGGSTTDDVGFILAMIDSFQVQYGIDLGRVYSCGLSNGGFFSYRLACEKGDRIAAIASVAGSMTTTMLEACTPVRPTPVMEIHGTADPVVDFNGSAFNAGIPEVVDFWASQNNCASPIANIDLPDVVTNDQATANLEIHAGCEDEVEVRLMTIENGGHTWPGAFPTVVFGATCQDFNASREIWLFFEKYHLDISSELEEELDLSDAINVYPNPFYNSITIDEMPENAGPLVVFDVGGSMIWNGFLHNNIDTHEWPLGIYFLRIITPNSVYTKRLIKQ